MIAESNISWVLRMNNLSIRNCSSNDFTVITTISKIIICWAVEMLIVCICSENKYVEVSCLPDLWLNGFTYIHTKILYSHFNVQSMKIFMLFDEQDAWICHNENPANRCARPYICHRFTSIFIGIISDAWNDIWYVYTIYRHHSVRYCG